MNWKNNPILSFSLLVFSCYRLALLVAKEEGPFSVFTRIRAWAGAYDMNPQNEPETALGRGITCPLCLGVWFAAALVLIQKYGGWPGRFFTLWLGISGAQVFLYQLSRDDEI